MKIIVKNQDQIPKWELDRDVIPNVGDRLFVNLKDHYEVIERLFVINEKKEYDFVYLICNELQQI